MMADLQLELTKLIGDKTLSFGCLVKTPDFSGWNLHTIVRVEPERKRITENQDTRQISHYEDGSFRFGSESDEIIGHPATLSDLHRWLNRNVFDWLHNANGIHVGDVDGYTIKKIEYDSSKDLINENPELCQNEQTVKAIIDLIRSHL